MAAPDARERRVSSGALAVPQRIGIYGYGTGGIGKTTLVSLARHAGKRVLVLDVDGGSWHVDCERLLLTSFAEVRAALADEALLAPYRTMSADDLGPLLDDAEVTDVR